MSLRELLGLKPTMKDLAVRLLADFSSQGKSGWTFDPTQNTLRDESGGVINLGNIFLEYSQSPRARRPDLLRKYSSMASLSNIAVPKLWELAAKGIFAALRSRFDSCVTSIQGRAEQKIWPATISWPWIGDLQIRVLYDWGDHMSHVKEELVDIWGQTTEAIKQRAIQNLRTLPLPSWSSLGNGVYQLMSEASYNESFVLVDKVFKQLPFENSVVCIASNRGTLLAADGNSSAALIALVDKALDYLQNKPWPLSATLLTRANSQWQEYQPEPESEVATRAGNLHRLSSAINYADQKVALDELNEKIGEDIYVATFGLLKRKADGDTLSSWCSWGEGVRASLPQTDLVAFGRQKSDNASSPILVPWDRVVALCGRHLKETTEDPPRFIVDSFPDDSEWETLAAASA